MIFDAIFDERNGYVAKEFELCPIKRTINLIARIHAFWNCSIDRNIKRWQRRKYRNALCPRTRMLLYHIMDWQSLSLVILMNVRPMQPVNNTCAEYKAQGKQNGKINAIYPRTRTISIMKERISGKRIRDLRRLTKSASRD